MAKALAAAGAKVVISDIQKDLGEVQKKLSAAEDSWMEAHEALEAAESEATGAA